MSGFQPKTQRDFVSAASGSASGSLAENLRPSWEIRWSIGYGRSIIGDHFVYMDMGQNWDGWKLKQNIVQNLCSPGSLILVTFCQYWMNKTPLPSWYDKFIKRIHIGQQFRTSPGSLECNLYHGSCGEYLEIPWQYYRVT